MRQSVILLLCLTAILTGSAGSRQTYRLKLAAVPPERSIWGKTFRAVAEEVARETGGQVKIKTYLGGVQGDERTVMRKMRIGQLQGGAFVAQGVSTICPTSLVLKQPLLFQDGTELDYVLKQIRPTLERESSKNGYAVLGWPELGFTYLFGKNKIRTVEDFRQSKAWLIESDPLIRELYDQLGVSSVSTSIANVLTALESGLVQTVFAPPAGLIALQWHSRVKYQLDVKMTYAFGVIAAAKKQWDRIPEDLRETVRAVFERHIASLNKKMRETNQEALKVIEKHGIERVPLAADQRKKLEQVTNRVAQKLATKYYTPADLKRVRDLLATYRQKPGK